MDYEQLGIRISNIIDEGIEDWDTRLRAEDPSITRHDVHMAFHAYPMPHTVNGEDECDGLRST